MTRFARAKGSKSSNEKKPEEATSWSEMRNSMLMKKSNKLDASAPKEEVKINPPKKSEWASLDDAAGEPVSLLKQHLSKNSKGEKKKNKNSENLGLNPVSSKEKKIKKLKNSDSKEVDSEEKKTKKGKKRKFAEDSEVSEYSSPKKKKLVKNEESDSGLNEITRKKDRKKLQKMRKTQNENNFKKGNKNKQNLKYGIGKQDKGGKKLKNKNFEGTNPAVEEIIINGEKIKIVKFQGFYVTVEDSERLKKLRTELIKEGIPKSQLEAAIKLERRRAEKALSRLKKSVCFHCRGHGHLLSQCPNLLEKENTGTGICYKCGSTEHSAAECRVIRETNYQFAECFICKEQGHIARQCPDNPRGLYPQGGGCRECGDVTHLRKDCPLVQAQKAEELLTVGVRNDRDLECLDEEIASREKRKSKKMAKRNSTVRF